MDISDLRRKRLRKWFSDKPIPEREKSYISQLLSGRASFGERAARRLERDYEMGQGYLDNDEEAAALLDHLRRNERDFDGGTDDGDYLGVRIHRRRPSGSGSARQLPANINVPVISWVQAGAWTEVIDTFQPGDAEEWMPCPVSHSSRTYVLRVRGPSMHNPHGRPSFQDGDLIFVDPEREAVHGSLVVVRLDEANEATFKQLVIEGEKKYLRALNPAWPEQIIQINGNATICGVVIFKGEKL